MIHRAYYYYVQCTVWCDMVIEVEVEVGVICLVTVTQDSLAICRSTVLVW